MIDPTCETCRHWDDSYWFEEDGCSYAEDRGPKRFEDWFGAVPDASFGCMYYDPKYEEDCDDRRGT